MPTIKLPVLIPLFVSLMVFFVLVSVLSQKRRSKVRRAFALFMGDLFALTIIEFVMKLPLEASAQVLLYHIAYVLTCCTGIVHCYFMYAVTEAKPDAKLWIFALLALLGATTIFIPGIQISIFDEAGRPVFMLSKDLAIGLTIGAFPAAFYALFLCIRHLRTPRDERERRIMVLLLKGTLFALLVTVGFLVVIPIFLPERSNIFQFSSVAVLIHAVYLSRAVSRYHFMSIDFDEIEEVSRSLFEHVSEAVVIFGAAGEAVQANRPAKVLFGETITGAIIKSKLPGYEPTKIYDGWRSRLDTKAGPRHVVISQSRIGREGQRDLGRLLILRDITDEVRLHEERVAIERRAHQSEKLEAIGQLAGGVAHDFNNQLAGITGYADLLREDLRDHARMTKFVNGILISAKRASDVTAQLLAYARKGQYLNIVIDINTAIGEVATMLQHSIDKRIALSVQLDAAQSDIIGDPSQIQNALLNLGLNARDAMEDGGTLTFRTTNEAIGETPRDDTLSLAAGRYVCISVEDTGVGMSDEVKRHIFEPFFTTKPEGKGTGMGLAAVYGTIKNHKGAIRVSSTPRQGSVFRVYLPVHDAEAEPRGPSDSNAPHIMGQGKILLVDDEPVVLETTQALLSRLGYQVKSVSSGEAAVQVFEKEWRDIDLVVLDLIMPGMGGDAVFEKLREIHPAAKVLIASGFSIDDTAGRLIEAGASGFIQKPFRKADLSRRIAEVLKPSAVPGPVG